MRETASVRSTPADGRRKLHELQSPSESVTALRVPGNAPSQLPGRAGPVPGRAASLAGSLTEKPPVWSTKEREIIDVATVHFLKHGYRGASVNAMARASGISKESVYRYFTGKKALFEAVIERELSEYEALRWRVGALQALDLRAALTTIATAVLSTGTTDRALAVQRLVFEEAVQSPAIGRRYHKVSFGQTYAALKQVFSSPHVVSDFDAAALSRHLMAMLSWRVTLERECALRPAPTKAEAAALAAATVDDFMKAFLRPAC